jgi:hypothetical protein
MSEENRPIQRTINLFVNGTVTDRIHDPELHKAIGYGMLWGNGDTTNISIDKDLDLGVSCQREGQQYFYMAGIRDKNTGKYSFHS